MSAREAYRVGGARAVVMKALPVLGYHRFVFFEARLNPPMPRPPTDVPLVFGFLERGGCTRWQPFGRTSHSRVTNSGSTRVSGVVARSDGEIVCAYWVHTRNVTLPEIGHEIVVPEDAVYVCDAFTSPAMRGRRVASALSRELKNRLAAEGYERWVSSCSAATTPD